MKNILLTILLTGLTAISVAAQNTEKGVDTQTKSIQKETKVNDRSHDVGRSFSFGKGKTKIRAKLDNPYPLTARRDFLIDTISGVLKDNKMILDESASKLNQGLIVTKPYTFSKGVILTKNEINRYADTLSPDQVFSRGRFSLTVEVQSIDGIRNNVLVNASVEGRSENGLFSEWTNLSSSGEAEDEFLAKLVEALGKDLNEEGRKP